MQARPNQPLETFHSDIGAPCQCGGTIFRYEVDPNTGRVDTFCYACHATSFFRTLASTATASETSAAHRAA